MDILHRCGYLQFETATGSKSHHTEERDEAVQRAQTLLSIIEHPRLRNGLRHLSISQDWMHSPKTARTTRQLSILELVLLHMYKTNADGAPSPLSIWNDRRTDCSPDATPLVDVKRLLCESKPMMYRSIDYSGGTTCRR